MEVQHNVRANHRNSNGILWIPNTTHRITRWTKVIIDTHRGTIVRHRNQAGILMVYKVDTNGAVGIPVSIYSNALVPHRYKLMDYKRNTLETSVRSTIDN